MEFDGTEYNPEHFEEPQETKAQLEPCPFCNQRLIPREEMSFKGTTKKERKMVHPSSCTFFPDGYIVWSYQFEAWNKRYPVKVVIEMLKK